MKNQFIMLALVMAVACKEKESPPVFTSQPQSLTVLTPYLAEFTAAVSGDGVTYQWQKNVGGQWTDIPGAVSYIYKVSATAAVNGTQFHLVAHNSSGTITSDAATLTVKKISDCLMATAAFSSRYLHTFSYDAAGRLVKEDILDNSTAKTISLTYSYNDQGKVSKISCPKWTDTFVYDSYGVPQTATRTDISGKTLYVDSYSWTTNTFQTLLPTAALIPGNQGPLLLRYRFSGNNLLWFKMGLASDTTQYDYSRYVDYDTQPSPEYLLYVSTGGSLIPIYFEGQTDNITDSPFFYDPKPVNNYRTVLNQAGAPSQSVSFTYNASGAPITRTKKQFGSTVGNDEIFTYINCKN
ncbi:MAG: hypothetical protein U0289_07715 [Cyclobacteriaceae bacterium]|jgi:hypothetical protein|nr:hypothetical protein [Cytophagales bacterium]HNP76667.1 hypothetical protein [Cyclobacteriaceae bacterium]HQQ81708.1 hypothetical protein [Cyclobacteriaceae bacterium]